MSLWFLSQVEMSTPRELAAATAFDGKIYIMGGVSDDDDMTELSSGEVCSQCMRKTIEYLMQVYDPETTKWTPLPNFTRPRFLFENQTKLQCIILKYFDQV